MTPLRLPGTNPINGVGAPAAFRSPRGGRARGIRGV